MHVLTEEEIGYVAGGKSITQVMSEIWDWLTGGSPSPPTNSGGIVFTASDIGQMQRDCLQAGGEFHMSAGAGSGGLNVNMAAADGTVSVVNISCTF